MFFPYQVKKEYTVSYHETICNKVIDKIISATGYNKEISEVNNFHDRGKKRLAQKKLKRLVLRKN